MKKKYKCKYCNCIGFHGGRCPVPKRYMDNSINPYHKEIPQTENVWIEIEPKKRDGEREKLKKTLLTLVERAMEMEDKKEAEIKIMHAMLIILNEDGEKKCKLYRDMISGIISEITNPMPEEE